MLKLAQEKLSTEDVNGTRMVDGILTIPSTPFFILEELILSERKKGL